MNQQDAGEFSQWLTAMRLESQQQPHERSPASTASSWADTDSDSDSDSERASHFATCASASKRSAATNKMVPTFERTAPMVIPQKSRRRRAYFVNEFEQDGEHSFATTRGSTASNSSLFDDDDDAEDKNEDDDDPALYQNLAYFRSQNARKASHRSERSRSSSPSRTSPTASDEDIFDMEL